MIFLDVYMSYCVSFENYKNESHENIGSCIRCQDVRTVGEKSAEIEQPWDIFRSPHNNTVHPRPLQTMRMNLRQTLD